ncbi:TPM domain-containing protein [Methylobacterium sp. 77]|uniref:TPM domain-containing protein n=1 Tax=Methylobacterium sp. 77 TaxID=1101192 RepID=UPI000365FB79|nr:TPM domain-containing protein [Methylobacterium sp. 77]
MLSETDRTRIAQAIATAETATSAEIVVLVAARAGLYRSAALVPALALGLAIPWPLILLTPWSAASIALVQAATVLIALAAAAHPRARLALVPHAIRRERAHEAATREFAGRGLAGTRGRTGILIYLAMAEGHAEIVADSGIASRISPAAWSSAIGGLLSSLRRGEAAEGLVTAVETIGAILAQQLPRQAGDTDELPNRVIVTD